MKAVKTMQKYKCDFCKKRSIKTAMERHEKVCFRNPNRFCDYCENKGYTWETELEGYPSHKVDCPFCSRFDAGKLKDILEYEKQTEISK